VDSIHFDRHRIMKPLILSAIAAATLITVSSAAATPSTEQVGYSPWGPGDEIGALNKISPSSILAVLSRINSGKVYDLSVEYFVGMPSYYFLGQPRYQIWNVHTPQGTIVDDPTGLGKEKNSLVTYSGSAISMYVHTGTHIDALSHFGLNGLIYNGHRTDEHLGDRGWRKGGVEKYPPIIARGVLLDVARYKGVDVLPAAYGITIDDLQQTARTQGVTLEDGDVVMVRTGRMRWFREAEKYMHDTPGLTRESANHLADRGAIVIGVDNISTDVGPSKEANNWVPVHSSMLSQRGVPIMQNVNLEQLAADRVYKFAWIGAPLKLRGADGAPMRPIALPIH
jgi:kynurenine formamidase